MPGKCSHSCPLAAFLLSLLLALLFMAASSSYPTRSSDRARNAATQISTTFRTSPLAWARDDELKKLIAEILSYPGVPARWREPELEAPHEFILPMELRLDGKVARMF